MSYYKTVRGKTYGPYKNKDRAIHYWTAHDLNRLIISLRKKGQIKDETLLRAIADSFGIAHYICGYVQLVKWLKMTLLITAIYGLFKGVKLVLKGYKLLRTTIIAKTIEWSVWFFEMTGDAAHANAIGNFFIWMGAAEIAISLVVLYIEAFLDTASIIDFADRVCRVEEKAFTIYKPLEFIGLDDVLLRIYEKQVELETEINKTGHVSEIVLFPDA